GPFELMDLVGIDVNYSVSTSVWEQLGRPARLTPHSIQATLRDRGQLGRKTKRGFYDYDKNPPEPAVSLNAQSIPSELPSDMREAVESLIEHATEHPGTALQTYIFARILATIINEAAMLLDQGVASREDIDTAMRLGTNYPHGPVEWADRIGFGRCGKI